MPDLDQELFELIHRAGGGPSPEPPIAEVLLAGGQRRRRRLLEVTTGVGIVVAAVLAVTVFGVFSPSSSMPSGTTTSFSARVRVTPNQLVHGHWQAIPAAPIKACEPSATWDGAEVLVIDPDVNHCSAAAAAYNPTTDTWRTIAAPPDIVGENPVEAYAAGRIVMVNPKNGVTVTWASRTDHWKQIASVPTPASSRPDLQQMTITGAGSALDLVVVDQDTTHGFTLDAADQWKPLPNLVSPPTGRISTAPMAYEHHSLYALVGVTTPAAGGATGGYVELQRLVGERWIRVLSPLPTFGSPTTLSALRGDLLAVGSACHAAAACFGGSTQLAALIRPRPRPVVTPVALNLNTFSYVSLTSADHAIVAVYPRGYSIQRQAFPPGATQIYDASSHRWVRGPALTATNTEIDQAVLTPDGLVTLTELGGGTDPVTVTGHLLRTGG